MAGSSPAMFTSHLSQMFVMADLTTILCHEFTNPLVVPHIQSLPEDAGETLGEAAQVDRWHYEVNPNLACPMVRAVSGKDYFVDEMAMVVLQPNDVEEVPVVIQHWFRKKGTTWGDVSPLLLSEDRALFIIDKHPGCSWNILLSYFRLSVLDLCKPTVQQERSIPAPDRITGLPRSLVHLLYNIHYLATSNLAPPLEMMEELVEQLW
ncbi:hypothetical protein C8Q77DRAFT_1159659 [Trametes polyzona]|nr:hypothetical protein C8Q77DRAFT_1159659 [Trametes polyzona]